MDPDPRVPIFWTADKNLLINISHIAWILPKEDGSLILQLSATLPDGDTRLIIQPGRQRDELLATIGTGTDRRGHA